MTLLTPNSYPLSPVFHIAVEGNIGAGKTTLAEKLSADLGIKFVREQFGRNPNLKDFYRDPAHHAFEAEMAFLSSRYGILTEQVKKNTSLITDFTFEKCLVFGQVNLKGNQRRKLFSEYEKRKKALSPPRIIIYLHVPVELLMENIRKRGRPYERKIKKDYLVQLQEGYEGLMGKLKLYSTVIKLNIAVKDIFLKNTDYEKLWEIVSGH